MSILQCTSSIKLIVKLDMVRQVFILVIIVFFLINVNYLRSSLVPRDINFHKYSTWTCFLTTHRDVCDIYESYYITLNANTCLMLISYICKYIIVFIFFPHFRICFYIRWILYKCTCILLIEVIITCYSILFLCTFLNI